MAIKNKLSWIIITIMAVLAVSIIVVPPMVNLNFLKPKIETFILNKTGVKAQIQGDINFSLVGQTRIVAHNITIPNGVISTFDFSVPFFSIFNLKNTTFSGDIHIDGASLLIEKIVPFETDNKIIVTNSNIQFLNKEYRIVNAEFSKNNVTAFVRTNQHKYEIKAIKNNFTIRNKNNDLNLTGELFNDGTAIAHIEIVAQNINKWFEFERPKIVGQFPVVADVFWNGEYGVQFYNISANGITGSVDLKNDGQKIIDLKANDANYDLNFLLDNPDVLQNASFNLNFYGNLKLANKKYHHIKVITYGENDKLHINTIIADDMVLHGGTIDKDGAHNVHITVPEFGVKTTCIFNGTPNDWTCDNFSYGGIVSGTLHISTKHFEVDLYSPQPFKNFTTVIKMAQLLGKNGYVKFDVPDMKGTLVLTDNEPSVSYTQLIDKSLNWAKIDLPFIPDFMREEKGNFIWTKDSMMFVPESKQWQLSTTKDFFILHGDDFKKWFPNLDLQSLRDSPYTVSGNYKNGNISNLIVEFSHHKFTGNASKKSITLKTNTLNLNSFIDPHFSENFEELQFFTAAPIMIPFDLDANVAISANTLVYKDKQYNNFIYSLRKNVQSFSITDSDRGNILATIQKDNKKYTLNIQLNKFIFDKKLLPLNMPLNISDTMVTAEIKLKTSGVIAHDIIHNINGRFDASFYGGKLYGFGFDKFYASAPSIKILNGEEYLNNALRYGTTSIKKMHINGIYEHGDIKTLYPLTLSMKHIDASGMFEIKNDEMFAKLGLILRGTSSGPEPIEITIYPNDERDFSLSQIMLNFDPEYMREFVKSHDKF